MLTEAPLNPPENREYAAEIMFETFNVPGLYIAVQAVLALASSFNSNTSEHARPLTGVVVDSGEGVTHVIPVADGYAIGSSIKSMPIAGRDATAFVQQLMHESLDVARRIKESHSYVCSDLVKEFAKHDREPDKYHRVYNATHRRTGQPYACAVGYERFLAPEIFFQPEIYTGEGGKPLPQVRGRDVRLGLELWV
eukprot:jgi/Chlat1/14/ChrspC225855S00899